MFISQSTCSPDRFHFSYAIFSDRYCRFRSFQIDYELRFDRMWLTQYRVFLSHQIKILYIVNDHRTNYTRKFPNRLQHPRTINHSTVRNIRPDRPTNLVLIK